MRIINNNFGVRTQVGEELNREKGYLVFTQLSRAERSIQQYKGWLELESDGGIVVGSTKPKQIELLEVILDFMIKHKYAPSYTELVELVELERNAVFCQVEKLVELGLLVKVSKVRGLRPTILCKNFFNLKEEDFEWCSQI